MRCKYCNCLLEEYDKGICRWCGKDNNVDFNYQVINKVNSNINHEHIKNEEFTTLDDDLTTELVKDYIGPNYEALKNGGFSFMVLLFGPYYFCYRKFLPFGIVAFFIEFFAGIMGVIFVHIVSGYIFKSSYIDYVYKKVDRYREEYSNYSYEKLSNICKYNGGVNLGFIIFPIIVSIIVIISLILIGFNG